MLLRITKIVNTHLAQAVETTDSDNSGFVRTVYSGTPNFLEVGTTYPFVPQNRWWNPSLPIEQDILVHGALDIKHRYAKGLR